MVLVWSRQCSFVVIAIARVLVFCLCCCSYYWGESKGGFSGFKSFSSD